MKIPTICDYCGGKVIFTDSAIVYHGKSYGNIYYCTNCGAYVGVHDGTKKPLGTLANAALRSKRREAHTFAPMEKKGEGREKTSSQNFIILLFSPLAPVRMSGAQLCWCL